MPRQEPPDNLALDNPLWQYALSLWSHEGMAQRCLEAQSQGLAVIPLLVALFCAARNTQVPEAEPVALQQWREGVTSDLRALRTSLPKHHSAIAALRDTVKAAELQAEQVELAWWWQHLAEHDLPGHPGLSRAQLARHNLDSLLPELAPSLAASLVELWREIMEANGDPL
ncbi:TIGR02444 family protein [Halomonadaceae bacterium KBTZ08]